MEPNKATKIEFDMPDVNHTFRRGHRIMVQVQSTWFPLVDLNPQKFVPNIYRPRPPTSRKPLSASITAKATDLRSCLDVEKVIAAVDQCAKRFDQGLDRPIRPLFLGRFHVPNPLAAYRNSYSHSFFCIRQAQAPRVTSAFFTATDGVKLHYLKPAPASHRARPRLHDARLDLGSTDRRLSKKYHVVAIDPRSQGDSDKPTEGNYFIRRAEDYRDLSII